MNLSTKQLLMAAAVAGMLGAAAPQGGRAVADEATGTCTEKNGCSGRGHCAGIAAGKEHACSGQNACSNNQIRNITKSQCDGYGGVWRPNP